MTEILPAASLWLILGSGAVWIAVLGAGAFSVLPDVLCSRGCTMINLMKMEWYRLRHSRLFGGLLLGIFIAGLFIGASETEGQVVASAAAKGNGGVQLIQQMMSEAVPMGFLASIFGVYLSGTGICRTHTKSCS